MVVVVVVVSVGVVVLVVVDFVGFAHVCQSLTGVHCRQRYAYVQPRQCASWQDQRS